VRTTHEIQEGRYPTEHIYGQTLVCFEGDTGYRGFGDAFPYRKYSSIGRVDSAGISSRRDRRKRTELFCRKDQVGASKGTY